MTTFTSHTKRGLRAARGFTLIEMLVSSGLSTLVMTGVLSSFVLMGQNSFNAASYSVMESESRRALATFTEEARMAKDITWNNERSVTLSIVSAGGTYLVTYAYDNSSSGSTAGCFYRRLGNVSSAQPTRILVRDVSDFAFRRYKVINGADYSAANDLETKQIQITLRAAKRGMTTVNATNAVLSARVVMRNKRVST